MRQIIDSFWRHYSDFKIAAAKDDVESVARLDRELTESIGHIINRPARDMGEIVYQFQFATDLINVEAEDVSCVQRNIDLIRTLVEKYIGMGMVANVGAPRLGHPGNLPYAVLDEDFYDELPDAAAVFKSDYTVSYANPAFMTMMRRSSESLLGRHAADLFGFTRFRTDLQNRMDECLSGALLRFTHSEETEGETSVKIYEFSPCYAPSKHFIGALVKLSVIPDRRELRAN